MFLKIEGSVGDFRGFLKNEALPGARWGSLEEMRRRFLQALEGARRSRPGGPFEVFSLFFVFPINHDKNTNGMRPKM